MAARFTNSAGQTFLIEAELFDKTGKSLSLFNGVQIFALQILDQPSRHGHAIIKFAHDHRNIMQFGDLRRTPAPFTTDDLIFAFIARLGAHQNGLQNAVFGDGSRQFRQRRTVRFDPGLKRARFQCSDGQVAR
jgi:hypothetical protein